MRKIAPFLVCLASLASLADAAATADAQLYKSVSVDGRVTYSDVPPASAAYIEQRPASRSERSDLPAELAAALKKNPVTLYTTGKCQPCDAGRDLLRTRGIPFSEKTVNTNDDLAVLPQVGGNPQFPLLIVGSQKQQGFEIKAWHAVLSTAGYPASSKLPKTYIQPDAMAAGERPKPEPKATALKSPDADATSRQPQAPVSRAPSAFRF